MTGSCGGTTLDRARLVGERGLREKQEFPMKRTILAATLLATTFAIPAYAMWKAAMPASGSGLVTSPMPSLITSRSGFPA